ncbi:hypothetical protein ACS0PU_000076 [Formica fusca]
MQFLCDLQLENETTTNIPVSESNEEFYDDSNICDGSSSSSGRGSRCNKRRLSMDDSVEGIFDRFAESLNQPVSVNLPPFMLPPPPPPDKAALFGNLIAAQLKEIDS